MTETPSPPTTDAPAGLPIDWAATLAEHDRRLRIAVSARLGERQAVEEVMQEIALSAVEQRAPVQEPGKIGAWLHRLAIRKTLLYRRGRGRQDKLVNRVARRGTRRDGPGCADPLDWLLRDERIGQVRQALRDLPGRDVEILMLKYTEDWSYRALADHLGISEGAVEARLFRARRRLRDALSGLHDHEVTG
jgi:RNA polymerase sigma-70 factor (ECF subfamily)